MTTLTYTRQIIKSEEEHDPAKDYIELDTLIAPYQTVEIKSWREGHQTPHVWHINGRMIPKLIEMLQAIQLNKNPEPSKQ